MAEANKILKTYETMSASHDELTAAAPSHAASMPGTSSSLPIGGQGNIRGGGEAPARRASVTTTLTQEATQQQQQDEAVLHLTLRARPSVRWDENVVDNEGLGRKSSKRCCIFHKQRSFGESSTDSSDYDSDRSGSSSVSSAGGDEDGKKRSSRKPRKIARPKQGGKKVPDFQRFHA